MHSSEIRRRRFATARGLSGLRRELYDVDEVDAFLVVCADALAAAEAGRGSAAAADGIVTQQFRARRFGAGYVADEVDDYLDDIVVELRRHLAAG
ncbi:DivIVA domain-containing protein [Microbacterium sp. NPDC055357]